MQTVVYLSRFRDSLTPGAIPLVEEFDHQFRAESAPLIEVISIHRHGREDGRYLVFEWSWDSQIQEWRQTSVTNVASLANAREYVPGGFERLLVPPTFGIEAWKVVR
jgi:hypothetical protein